MKKQKDLVMIDRKLFRDYVKEFSFVNLSAIGELPIIFQSLVFNALNKAQRSVILKMKSEKIKIERAVRCPLNGSRLILSVICEGCRYGKLGKYKSDEVGYHDGWVICDYKAQCSAAMKRNASKLSIKRGER